MRRVGPAPGVALAALLVLPGCAGAGGEGDYAWDLPSNFPTPQVPEDNPMSVAKVELGRRLFYDPRLSLNETQSCGSCHLQELAFTDGRPQGIGSTGEVHPRSSMSLANVAYVPRLTWANPLIDTLEEQALGPLFGEDPVELGMAGQEEELFRRLREDPDYPMWFEEAFPRDPDPIGLQNLLRALAAFQRTLISADSPFDRFARGDATAMSESAQRGADLFFSERLECFHCHGGFNFSDALRHDGTIQDQVAFHNNGLYNVDGRGGYPPPNTGVFAISTDLRDMGRFRAPTLRNIEVTAPYFHDGSAATLDDVIDHYAAGGRTIEEGPNAGVGAESPLKSIFVNGFELTPEEREDLLAFLRSLTDETFLTDPRFRDPFLE
ncbi:MAG: MbnH family di-heme enzyme [Sandaracinaceae bacterium]